MNKRIALLLGAALLGFTAAGGSRLAEADAAGGDVGVRGDEVVGPGIGMLAHGGARGACDYDLLHHVLPFS